MTARSRDDEGKINEKLKPLDRDCLKQKNLKLTEHIFFKKTGNFGVFA